MDNFRDNNKYQLSEEQKVSLKKRDNVVEIMSRANLFANDKDLA